MEGGSQGLFLRLRLPIALPDGTIKHNLFPPVWCFTANVDGVDLVIGYPYLKTYNLMVDAGDNCLRPSLSGNTHKLAFAFSPFPSTPLLDSSSPSPPSPRLSP